MPLPLRLLLIVVVAVLLGACASAPPHRGLLVAGDADLDVVRDRADSRLQRSVDAGMLASRPPVRLPQVAVVEDLGGAALDAEQRALVANQAARSACTRLARHHVLVAEDDVRAAAAVQLRLLLTDLKPTSVGLAGTSALVDFVVPGPFRLPAGLGSLAAEALAELQGQPVLQLRWAKGANPLLDDPQMSAIGDAWQLAEDFGKDVADSLLPQGDEGERPPRVDEDQLSINRTLCRERFGEHGLAARGAARFLPLSPEQLDKGAPQQPEASAAQSEAAQQQD